MYVPRINEHIIFKSFQDDFITVILGPRRVGKSTLISEYAKKNHNAIWAFLNMDHRDDKIRIDQGELTTLIEEKTQKKMGGEEKLCVIIDEAQKSPLLFDQVKFLYDKYKDQKKIKFILTGSGFLTLHQLTAESLAGRIEFYHLREFGLQETTALQHNLKYHDHSFFHLACEQQDLKQLEEYIKSRAPFRPMIETSLSEQLIWGGMPEVIRMTTPDTRHNYLSNYLQTYFEKDIRAITTINDLNLYQRLLEITAEQTGSVRQDTEIIEALGCSRDTLKKYRGFLLATFIYKELYPFIERPLKRLVKSPKGYLLNNGLISHLTGLDDFNILKKTGLIGHRFENWFLKELQIWLDHSAKRSDIYYWRTSGGIEVDFIAVKKPFIFPFEVTYSSHIQNKKVKNLTYFLKNNPKIEMGFYIYMGDFHYDKQKKICFLPAWGLG